MLDRMLRLLASFNIVNCTLEKGSEHKVARRYGPAQVCKFLMKDDYGFAIYLGMHQAFFNALYMLILICLFIVQELISTNLSKAMLQLLAIEI
jgi:hypothetical protein